MGADGLFGEKEAQGALFLTGVENTAGINSRKKVNYNPKKLEQQKKGIFPISLSRN
jgi:hypothetical protein